jgi:hypothetical protein
VWLRLQHRPMASIPGTSRGKLAASYYGPYKITACVGSVTYRLQLPPRACLHDVFHVSQLKVYHGEPPEGPPTLPELSEGRVVPTPLKILKSRQRDNVRQLLVWWTWCGGQVCAASEASWRPLMNSRSAIQIFSSRTSCLQRRGVMSWPTIGGASIMCVEPGKNLQSLSHVTTVGIGKFRVC